ncbi:hypothetical protein pkur_cds_538 [Pandoravirus kuranda]|uniref:Uncharacterized protein n=1 Tax=Pandoravirus kuranda TaxID=3019033 RepID=A0AA95J3Q6_9VIRU|nr:hypothetical protein pkur_cds_538 [Pandoravirus kuranda]
MKRMLASPAPSARALVRRRVGRCDDREAAIESLRAAWSRALDGTGSAEDVALWRRFAVLTPSDPDAAFTLARSAGVPVDALVASVYEPMWERVGALPAVASWMERQQEQQERENEPKFAPSCLLPLFTDLIDAAERNVPDDSRASLSRIIDDLVSPDAGVRSQAATDLVTVLDVSLRRRDILAALGEGSIAPDYPPALPPSTWAAAVEALGAEPETCSPARAYYVMRARIGPHPEGAVDGLPQEGGYAFMLGPYGDQRDAALARGAFVPPGSVLAQTYDHDGGGNSVFDPTLPLLRASVDMFLAALAQAPPFAPYRLDHLAGVSQVRDALVPLYDLNDLPDRVARTFYDQVGVGEDWWAAPIEYLAGVWISECELVAAVRVFGGQVEARRHASLFASRLPTLFDTITDAVARGMPLGVTAAEPLSLGGGYVPRDAIERMLPRLWFRTCSADPDPVSGTLPGAPSLAGAARALGIPTDAAASLRPELLCDALAQRAIHEQTRERFRDFVPPTVEEGTPLWPGLGGDDDGTQGGTADNPFVFS